MSPRGGQQEAAEQAVHDRKLRLAELERKQQEAALAVEQARLEYQAELQLLQLQRRAIAEEAQAATRDVAEVAVPAGPTSKVDDTESKPPLQKCETASRKRKASPTDRPSLLGPERNATADVTTLDGTSKKIFHPLVKQEEIESRVEVKEEAAPAQHASAAGPSHQARAEQLPPKKEPVDREEAEAAEAAQQPQQAAPDRDRAAYQSGASSASDVTVPGRQPDAIAPPPRPYSMFKAAALHVLRQAGRNLHYMEITRLALEQNLLTTYGKTPGYSMNAMLNSDLGKPTQLFTRFSEGMYGLREWEAGEPGTEDGEQARHQNATQNEAGPPEAGGSPAPKMTSSLWPLLIFSALPSEEDAARARMAAAQRLERQNRQQARHRVLQSS